jgi:hypothetical protein
LFAGTIIQEKLSVSFVAVFMRRFTAVTTTDVKGATGENCSASWNGV